MVVLDNFFSFVRKKKEEKIKEKKKKRNVESLTTSGGKKFFRFSFVPFSFSFFLLIDFLISPFFFSFSIFVPYLTYNVDFSFYFQLNAQRFCSRKRFEIAINVLNYFKWGEARIDWSISISWFLFIQPYRSNICDI